MAIQKPEWFKLDAAKFLSDAQVDAMTTLELGACVRLLCRQWIDGFIPDDLRTLGRLCRLSDPEMEAAWPSLCVFFPVVGDGKRANRFMWQERDRVVAELERRSDEGTRAARKRWDEVRKVTHATPNGSPMPHPMQDQTRPDQISADGSPMPDPSLGDDRFDRAEGFNSTEVSRMLCSENGWSGQEMIWTLKNAIEFQAKQMPEASTEQIGEWLIKAYRGHQLAQGKFAVGVKKFFAEGRYKPAPRPGEGDKYFRSQIFVDNPATRALAQMEAD
jgi:uncharacterized protein YdaU (DUF1376 family)